MTIEGLVSCDEMKSTAEDMIRELEKEAESSPDAIRGQINRTIAVLQWIVRTINDSENTRSLCPEGEVREDGVRLFEATLKLIAYPELQSDYTPQQLARHALRIEPLLPQQEGVKRSRRAVRRAK